MPRIVFVVDSFAELGLFGQLKPLVIKLADASFDSHVVSLNEGNISDLETRLPASFHCVESTGSSIQEWFGMRNLLQRLQPDLIHAWGANAQAAVLTSSFFSSAKRYFSHFCREPSNAVFQQALLLGLANRNDVHVYSHHSINPAIENAQTRIVVNSISSTCDDTNQSRQHLLQRIECRNDKVILVGTVASFDPKYHLKDLAWAVDLLCCVRDDIHLLVFGSGNPKPLQRFIGKTVAGNNIHLFDIRDSGSVDLAGLDLYWNSQREHPNPTPMINCMANKIPVVSVLDDETSDLVLPLQTALATNFGARDEFARWTKYLVEQTGSANLIATQAKAHVEKLFTTEQMTGSYMKLYNEG